MTTAVWVSNADSGDITVLHLDEASGALTTVQSCTLGGMVMPLALSPDRRFLYAARRSAPLAVVSLAIDPGDGRLTLLGETALPDSMAAIATDRLGTTLFSASYGGNVVAVSPIGADGRVEPATQVLSTAPHAHAIRADLSNRHVFATSLGGGHVLQFRFDSGRLQSNDPACVQVHAGAGPRHLEFHPNGRVVYLLNELDASLVVFDLEPDLGTLRARQTLSTLPAGFSGEPWAADLHLSPDARFLYTSERRSSTLAVFAVDASDGGLRPLGSVTTQAQPRGFAIDPSGRFLLVAGQSSHRLGVHAIDPHTGALTARHDHPVGRNPNWVETLRLA